MGCRVAPGSTLLFRRSVFYAIGPQDERLRNFEDWDWLLRVARKFRFGHASSARVVLKPSSRTRYDITEESLQYFENKWIPLLEPECLNKLKAAIAIERAAMGLRKSHYVEMGRHLLEAAMLSPETLHYNFVQRYMG